METMGGKNLERHNYKKNNHKRLQEGRKMGLLENTIEFSVLTCSWGVQTRKSSRKLGKAAGKKM